jgi:vanillate O-demethylase monooxygenase subunit
MQLSYFEVERGFNDDLGERERLTHYRHELTYPFATSLRCEYTSDEPGDAPTTSYFFDVASPVTANQTDIYQITLTNIPGATAEDYVNYQLVTNEEDILVVESQRPEAVPLDLAVEMHIPADKFSIWYRRDLVDLFGLGSPSLVR